MSSTQTLQIENPLRQGLRLEATAEPCALVIFGASGDLTRRKLLPALYNLTRENRLANSFAVIGVARREKSDESFREEMRQAVAEFSRSGIDQSVWDSFAKKLFYLVGDFNDAEVFPRVKEALAKCDRQHGTQGNYLYYLSTPPEVYDEIIAGLGSVRLQQSDENTKGWKRIIIEKPFGYDLASARELNNKVAAVFDESQVFRIDHYLGKETVQNISVFRFANGIFEPIWNRNYIDHVQITAAEEVTVGSRAGYYDQVGALRDMIQNHMLQVFALTAMEPPVAFDADSMRDEKQKAFRAIRQIEAPEVPQYTVRAQYSAGSVSGKAVKGYLQEEGVNAHSTTETYAAIKFYVESWRWAGVPFYIRSGKAMPRRITEVAIQFKQPPHTLFDKGEVGADVLVLRIQPDEGISLKSQVKLPGQSVRIRPVMMDFRYGTSFGIEIAEAYERLILDCMLGDSTLFARRDGVETTWEFVTKILDGWKEQKLKELPQYEAGTWGPVESEELLRRDGRRWRRQ